MNFFASQDRARRSSRLMAFLFAVAVVAIVLAVDAVFLLVVNGQRQMGAPPGAPPGVQPAFTADFQTLIAISVCVLLGIGLASLFRVLSLREGGSAVARSMGATLVTPDTQNPAWRRLRNVIEEIAIASGVAVPDVYVMESEAGINAFAAGFSTADAAVCVTQGSLDKLTRDELQGVIAHEFSHILNGDMRFNVRLTGLLFGILILSITGRHIIFTLGWMRGRRGGANIAAILLAGVALLIIGYIGYFFGRLIQAAAARSRESLADASAVQFTRQSAGLAGALKKIAALEESSRLDARESHHIAHMLFGEGGSRSWRLLATHPPLMERIQQLEPGFKVSDLQEIGRDWQEPVKATDADSPHASLSGFAPAMAATAASTAPAAYTDTENLPPADSRSTLDRAGVVGRVAQPDQQHFKRAGVIRRQLPEDLQNAARDGQRSPLLIMSLAIAPTEPARTEQLARVAQLFDDADYQQIRQLAEEVQTLHPLQRMPLAALAFPSLRRRPATRLRVLVDHLDQVIHATGQANLAEFCLARLIQLQVMDSVDPPAASRQGRRKLGACLEELRDLFVLVAEYGNPDPNAAQRAFTAACEEAVPGRTLTFQPPRDWQKALNTALTQLEQLGPLGKERVIAGLTRAINDDGQVAASEAELLRVVCAALRCPLPPITEG